MRITVDAIDEEQNESTELAFESSGDHVVLSVMEYNQIGEETYYRRFRVDMLEWAKLLEASRGFLVERVNT